MTRQARERSEARRARKAEVLSAILPTANGASPVTEGEAYREGLNLLLEGLGIEPRGDLEEDLAEGLALLPAFVREVELDQGEANGGRANGKGVTLVLPHTEADALEAEENARYEESVKAREKRAKRMEKDFPFLSADARGSDRQYPAWKPGEQLPAEWLAAIAPLPAVFVSGPQGQGAQVSKANLALWLLENARRGGKFGREYRLLMLDWLRTHPEDRGPDPLPESSWRKLARRYLKAERRRTR